MLTGLWFVALLVLVPWSAATGARLLRRRYERRAREQLPGFGRPPRSLAAALTIAWLLVVPLAADALALIRFFGALGTAGADEVQPLVAEGLPWLVRLLTYWNLVVAGAIFWSDLGVLRTLMRQLGSGGAPHAPPSSREEPESATAAAELRGQLPSAT